MDRQITRSLVNKDVERIISRILTCGPHNCLHEVDCFKLAQYARDVTRFLHSEIPAEYEKPHPYFCQEMGTPVIWNEDDECAHI